MANRNSGSFIAINPITFPLDPNLDLNKYTLEKEKQINFRKGEIHFTKRQIQSGASSLAKHGGAYFSAVYGPIKDPIAAPGQYKPQEC